MHELFYYLVSKPSDYALLILNCDSVTKNYFENLVRALENGLADVDSDAACSKAGISKPPVASKGKSGRGKGICRAGGSHDAGK